MDRHRVSPERCRLEDIPLEILGHLNPAGSGIYRVEIDIQPPADYEAPPRVEEPAQPQLVPVGVEDDL